MLRRRRSELATFGSEVVITEVMALHGRFRKLADHMQAHTHSATTSGRSEPPEIYVVQDVRSMDMHSTEYAWTKQLHGHIWECGGDIEAAEAELAKSGSLFSGQVHQALQAMTEKYGQENFTVARVSAGWGCEPRLEPWLIISDPDDAARISRMHTKKSVINQPSFLDEGILGLNDNDEWSAQRNHLILGLLPVASLQHHFNTIVGEAEQFVHTLTGKTVNGTAVEINELLSDKTLSVLGATLFDDIELFQRHSEAIRWAYTWALAGFLPIANTTQVVNSSRGVVGGMQEREFAKELGVLNGQAAVGSQAERTQVRAFIDNFAAQCMTRAQAKSKGSEAGANTPKLGPGALIQLASELESMDRDHHEYPSQSGVPTPSGKSNLQQSQLDTISSLVFAGHDTTANTLSWCIIIRVGAAARAPEEATCRDGQLHHISWPAAALCRLGVDAVSHTNDP
jgi:hypothetical protein